MSSIGKRLKRQRVEQGLSQKAIADTAGVTNAAVSKWESNGGDAMSAVVALKVATTLNVNPFWLIFGKGRPNDRIEVPELSASAQELARSIERLPQQMRDALRGLLHAMQA